MNDTVVLSFRSYKNLKSWLEYAGDVFKSEGELLRLIVTKAAIEQIGQSRADNLLSGILGGKRQTVGIGDTRVFGVRLPVSTAKLVRDCADRRSKSTSEWCAAVLVDWWGSFQELSDKQGDDNTAWLPRWAADYRALVDKRAAVYAQKRQKQEAEVIK